MSRALTAQELTYIRTNGQFNRLYLWIDNPTIVFQALVNQSFSTLDRVYQVTYDTVTTGAYTDIVPGMTVWFGTSAGASNIGIARIRKAASSTKLYIGMVSGLALANNYYITVIDEYGLWAKHPYETVAGALRMDYETIYTDENTDFDPVPVLGSDAVKWLTGATVDVAFDASASYVSGSTITDHAWTASGGTWDDDTSATPTLTIDAAGRYRITDTVTANNGKTKTGYRLVRVFSSADMPITAFELVGSPSGDFNTGWWSFEVKLYAEAATSTVRDRAKVLLFAKDYFGDTEISIGPEADRENSVCMGWIAGETITTNSEDGSVTFSVRGPGWWLDNIPSSYCALNNVGKTASTWKEIRNLTVDKALNHLVNQRSTISEVIDCRLTGDTRVAPSFELTSESLLGQINAVAEKIFARAACNRLGQMWVEVDPNLTPVADRTWNTVMTITTADWRDDLTFERRKVQDTAQVMLSGIRTSGTSSTTLYSLSPGHVVEEYGSYYPPASQVLLSSQSQANELAGLIMGKENNAWEDITIMLSSGLRMFDIAPRMYAALTIAAGDTPRNLAFTGNIIPKDVTLQWDAEANTFLTELTCEAETNPENNTNGDIPSGDAFTDFPSSNDFDFDGNLDIPELPEAIPLEEFDDTPSRVLAHDTTNGLIYTENFNETDPTLIEWKQMNWGLMEAEYQSIHNMIMSPYGTVYVANDDYIWYASSPLSTYSVYVDHAELWDGMHANWQAYYTGGGYTAEDIVIKSFGYDADADNLGIVFSLDGVKLFFSIFDGSSFTVPVTGGDPMTDANDATSKPDKVSYSGQWRCTHAAGAGGLGQYITRYDNTGEKIETDTEIGLVSTGTGARHYPICSSSKFIVRSIADGVIAVCDCSTNPSAIETPVAVPDFPDTLGVDPTGQYIMAAMSNTIRKSGDAGSSWSGALSLPLSSIQFPSRIFTCDENRVVIIGTANSAAYTPIIYTPDFGANFVYKYGNLTDLFPSAVLSWDLLQVLP